jgi:hypothetical protein
MTLTKKALVVASVLVISCGGIAALQLPLVLWPALRPWLEYDFFPTLTVILGTVLMVGLFGLLIHALVSGIIFRLRRERRVTGPSAPCMRSTASTKRRFFAVLHTDRTDSPIEAVRGGDRRGVSL